MKGKVFVKNNYPCIRFYPSKGYRIISALCIDYRKGLRKQTCFYGMLTSCYGYEK